MYTLHMKIKKLLVIVIAISFLSGQAAFAAAPKSLPIVSLSSSSPITFNKPGLLSTSAGWSVSEGGGTWSVGDTASIAVSFPKFSKDVEVYFTSQANLSSKNPKVVAKVFVNSKLISTITYTSAFNGGTRSLLIPANVLGSNYSNVPIKLIISGASSPKSLGLGNDKRNLGVFLISLGIKSIS